MNRLTKHMTGLLAASIVLAPISQAAALQQRPILLPGNQGIKEQARIEAIGEVLTEASRNTFEFRANGIRFNVMPGQIGAVGSTAVRRGDMVRVVGELSSGNTIRAERVEVLRQGGQGAPGLGLPGQGGRRSTVLNGTIRSVDTNRRRMVVNADNNNVAVIWDEDADFIRNNNRSAARDFRAGDRVRVIGTRRGNGDVEARRIIFGGQAGWVNNAIGEIVALNSRDRTAEIDFDGEIWEVRLNSARIRSGNQNVNIEALRLGQDVRVTGRAQNQKVVNAEQVEIVRGGNANRPNNNRNRTLEGRIVNVGARNSAFRVAPASGDEVRFLTNQKTSFARGNRSVNFNALQEKQRVRVTAERSGDDWIAQRVEILN